MTERQPGPYRFRGHVPPSAKVSRPVSAVRTDSGGSATVPSSATVDIFDVIDSYGGWWGISAADVDRALQQVGDVDTLYVRVNSPGGEATEGIAIANLLRAHPADVRVTVYGLAASAASIIAIAGDRVSMAPGSLMMIHEASGIAFGDADTMRQAIGMLDAVSDSAAGLYALKAGGDSAEWRAVMKGVRWYTAEDAVAAKLADAVGIDPQLPANLPDVETDTEDDEPDIDIEIDIEISPAARAAARRFDLSMLPNTPAGLAHEAPAEPPVTHDPNTPKEDADMADTENKGLRERLGLSEDADDSAVLAKVDELLEQATKPTEPAAAADASAVVAALEADGKVVVSKARFDALSEQAEQGAQARAKQITDERNELIEAAMSAGKISRSKETREVWEREFARNFDTAKADLESLPARFPVGELKGTAGSDDTIGDAVFTDEEAGVLAQLSGTSKEGLLR